MKFFNMEKTKKKFNSGANKHLTTKPYTAEETLPFKRVYTNGIFEIEDGVFSRTYSITDVDFAGVGDEDEARIFQSHATFINSLDPSTEVQQTIYNKIMSKQDFRNKVFLQAKNDNFNHLRKEWNDMLEFQMQKGKNGIIAEKFYTVTTRARNIEDATRKFISIDEKMEKHMKKITGVAARPLSLQERISLLYDICHSIDKTNPGFDAKQYIRQDGKTTIGRKFDLDTLRKRGRSIKSVICPNGFEFYRDYFRMGDAYCRTFILEEIPSLIQTTFMENLQNLPCHMIINTFIEPQKTATAMKALKNQHQNIRAKLANSQKNAVMNHYSPELLSPELYEAQEEAKELRRALQKDNQKIQYVSMNIMLICKTKEELTLETENILETCSEFLFEFNVMNNMQEHGFDSCLPVGCCKHKVNHMFKTDNTTTLLPYNVRVYDDEHGTYYGLNQNNKSMIVFDRMKLPNRNGMCLGQSGFGKSFLVKKLLCVAIMDTNDEFLIIDPNREYSMLAEAFEGTVAKIQPGSGIYINPFDMSLQYADDENPVTLKIDYICSLYELLTNNTFGVNPIEYNIISRCVSKLYDPYLRYLSQTGKNNDDSKVPTMSDLYHLLKQQPEPEAENIALTLERIAVGDLDCFQRQTNINTRARVMIYDIYKIGNGMKNLGIQVALNAAWQRCLANSERGVRTHIVIDEAHILTSTPNAAKLLQKIYKEGRKFGCSPLAITQDVEDLVSTKEGRGMFNNTSFIAMLNQSRIGRSNLVQLLGISKAQEEYITDALPGDGLIYNGRSMIPFTDDFPKNIASELYHILNTDPKDCDEIA